MAALDPLALRWIAGHVARLEEIPAGCLPDHGSPESHASCGRGLPTAGWASAYGVACAVSAIMEGYRRPAGRGAAGARHGEVDDLHRGVHRGVHLAEHAPDGGLRRRADDPAGASAGDGLGPRPAGPDRQPVRAERGESLAHPDRDTERRAGAGSAATAGSVAGGGHADHARAVRLPAGPGLPARYPVQKLYGLVLAGAGSYRTEFVLPQIYVFLVLGLWLLWRTVGGRSGLVKLLLGREPRWRLLLLPVAAVAIELRARTTGSARAGGASCGTWPRWRPCCSSCGGSRPSRRIWR